MLIINECIYSDKELKTTNFSIDELTRIQKDVYESGIVLANYGARLEKIRKETLARTKESHS
jgi:hypothetical protein